MSERERGRHLRLGGLLVLAASAAVVVFLSLAGSALAATSVTCTDSASDQALLQTAINGGGTVLVHGHCLGNWDVANNVTLTGVGGAILDGGAVSSVLIVEPFVTLTVNSLKIENGLGFADIGGGILALDDSTVNVNNSTITGNSAFEAGGGIYAQDFAFVNLTGTTVSHNTAEFGGGILVDFAFLNATNSSVSNNTAGLIGGGIYLEFSNTALTSTHVAGNRAGDFGGGIANFDGSGIQQEVGANPGAAAARTGGKWARPNVAALPSAAAGKAVARPQQALLPAEGLTLTGSTVDHNTALGEGAGGIFNGAEEFDSPMSLISSTVAFNNAPAPGAFGGGIVNVGFFDLTGTATISGTAIRGNLARAGGGGGIYNEGAEDGTALVSLESSSVSPATSYLNGNQAVFGGGIYNDGNFGGASSVSVQPHASIIHNQAFGTGGGIYNACDADLLLAPGAVLMLNSPNNLFNAPCT